MKLLLHERRHETSSLVCSEKTITIVRILRMIFCPDGRLRVLLQKGLLSERSRSKSRRGRRDVDATENMFTTNQRVRVTLYAQFLSE